MMSCSEELSLLSKYGSLFLNPGKGVGEEGAVGWSAVATEESHTQIPCSLLPLFLLKQLITGPLLCAGC